MSSFNASARVFVVAGLGLASLAACSPTIKRPRLLSPGTAPFQRYNSTQFDPYPPNDLGPEISGGRPIDMVVPRNEVARTRQFMNGERPLATPGPVPLAAPIGLPTIPTFPAATYPSTPTLPPVSGPRY